MNIHLLDAGGAGLFYYFVILFVGFILVAVLLEAVIMYGMKYNTRFMKALLDSLVVNVVTVVIGFVLIEYGSNFFDGFEWYNILVFFVITVLLEWGLLHLLNKSHSVKRGLIVSLVMNVASYITLLLFIGERG